MIMNLSDAHDDDHGYDVDFEDWSWRMMDDVDGKEHCYIHH